MRMLTGPSRYWPSARVTCATACATLPATPPPALKVIVDPLNAELGMVSPAEIGTTSTLAMVLPLMRMVLASKSNSTISSGNLSKNWAGSVAGMLRLPRLEFQLAVLANGPRERQFFAHDEARQVL